ncbi:MAG: RagB/SusD family nutrient uptake outer membrane protein, partial [Bacteroidales bacterium]
MKKLTYLIFIVLCLSIKTGWAQFGTDTMEIYLIKAYYDLSSKHLYAACQWIFGDCAADLSEVGGEAGGEDWAELQESMYHDIKSDNFTLIEYGWRAYTMIYACNYTIQHAPYSSLSEELKARYVAEARFIRAMTYFNLARMFDSIPVLLNKFEWPMNKKEKFIADMDCMPDNKIYSTCNSLNEILDQVKLDLTEAIPDLLEKSELSEEQKFCATKGAAKALLGKVLLYESSYAKNYSGDSRFEGLEERWDEALDILEQVINSGEYELVGINGEKYDTWWNTSYLYAESTPAYRYIFTVDGNDSPESVFSARNLLPPDVGWNTYGGNYINVFTTVRDFYYNDNSYWTDGWGFNCPTDTLLQEFEAGDPRLPVTIAQEGDSIYLNMDAGLAWYKIDFSSTPTGMSCRKFECSPPEFWDIVINVFQGPMNIPVIRFADVILMTAEAALESGNSQLALEYLNMVRTRARNSGNTGVPADLVTITLDDIIHERTVELALEGHRFFDLVRWGLAEEYLDGLYVKAHDKTATFEAGIDEFYPIPEFIKDRITS